MMFVFVMYSTIPNNEMTTSRMRIHEIPPSLVLTWLALLISRVNFNPSLYRVFLNEAKTPLRISESGIYCIENN
jgi:cell shape-determining protein MreD